MFVYKYGEDFVIILNEDGLPRLQMNSFYMESMKGAANKEKEYFQDKMRSAAWLMKSLYQRQRTLYKVVESIVGFQRNFFEDGVTKLKPLILKEVAEDIEMHESTVSRITTNKYVSTPHGIFELKFFFNSALDLNDGSQVGSESVKALIKQMIADEDTKKPLSDERIGEILKDKLDVNIARRTVAKYRSAMGSPLRPNASSISDPACRTHNQEAAYEHQLHFQELEPSDHLKGYAKKRFEKVARYISDAEADLQVNLLVEKFRHKADVILNSDHIHISAYESSEDMYSTIDMVLDKLEAQLRKMREKLKDRSKQARGNKMVQMNVLSYADMSESDAPRIVGTDEYEPKPMSVDEAAMQLDTLENEFLVFRNAETEGVNVIYKRKNGDYGLIDPGY